MSLFPPYIAPGDGSPLPDEREALIILGYRNHEISDTTLMYCRNSSEFTDRETARVKAILAALTAADAEIAEAVSNSAVEKTCKTETNWKAHIRMLRDNAHMLLEEFARIYDAPLMWSKYQGPRRSASYVAYKS